MGCSVNRRPNHVEAGHWGATLAVYIPITKEVEDADGDEDERETYWILKQFTVFNADQINGANAEKFRPWRLLATFSPITRPPKS